MDPTDLLSTPANYATPQQLSQLREYANALLPLQPEHIQHWTQGVNEMARALMGGLAYNKANTLQQQQRGAQADFLESLANTGGGPSAAAYQPAPGTPQRASR